MTALRLPTLLAEHLASNTDPARRRWLDRLGDVIAQIAGQWEPELGEPFEPGGACAWVAPARTASGARLALKVGWVHPEATHEAAGLCFWDGDGAVRLLQEMCERWAREYEAETDRPRLDPGIERAGIELFRTLPASAERQVLLATDLHGQNVLAAQREPWLAIDPKPHVGDPAFDPLQHMINCERVVIDPAGLAQRHAELLGLDPERLRLWLFARCVQGSPERPDLAELAVRLAP